MELKISRKYFDAIIIGSGGSGLMSALEAKNNGISNIAVITKVLPCNSHTVSAKGGINAALGNVLEDDWKWHAFDTLKSGDYLADVDAVEILCKEAKSAILYLEKIGVVFSRNNENKISQRAYGGQTANFGEGKIAYRACYAKDKTGHTILHSLYSKALSAGIKFFSEFFVVDLLIDDKSNCYGCITVDLNNGELTIFESKHTVIASGGYSQIYQNTTSSTICSGDCLAYVFAHNLPLQDMEFVQFHPTGIANLGFLITEAVRGEGAYLLNCHLERFMKKYAPKMMELASRDIISQAMATEVHEGSGAGKNKNYLYLDLRHLSSKVLNEKLPGVVDLVNKFLNLDVQKDLIPVSPSAHYTMGGIPTNIDCVVIDEKNNEVKGLLAVGESACLSVHGANRLGCNSLLDLLVFGKIAGQTISKNINKKDELFTKNIEQLILNKITEFKNIFSSDKFFQNPNKLEDLKDKLKRNNEKYLGVFREEKLLKQGLEELQKIFKDFKEYRVLNKSILFNEELILYFELKALILNSLATNLSALNRKESRGAHYRSDFRDRDDKNFCFHSLVKMKNYNSDEMEFLLKPVNSISKIHELNLEVKARKY